MLKRASKYESKISSAIETVTPKMAAEILSKNTNNRNLSDSLSKFYQRQMIAGSWDLNGESIKIASDGTLLDGQHRLDAISKANIPVQMFVIRGLDKSTFVTIDCGKTRTHADHLKVNGVNCSNPNVLAAAARICLGFAKSGKYTATTRRIPAYEIVGYVDNNPNLIESMLAVPSGMGSILSLSVASALHYQFSYIDADLATEFFDKLYSGSDLSDGNPILTLRNRLLSVRGTGRGGSDHRRMVVYFVVHCFNLYRKKKSLTVLKYQSEYEVSIEDYAGSVL